MSDPSRPNQSRSRHVAAQVIGDWEDKDESHNLDILELSFAQAVEKELDNQEKLLQDAIRERDEAKESGDSWYKNCIAEQDRALAAERDRDEAKAEVERLNALLLTPPEGHDQPCYYCGEKCNSLAGNPSLWPLLLPVGTEVGEAVPVHVRCVVVRLRDRDSACKELAAMRKHYTILVESHNKEVTARIKLWDWILNNPLVREEWRRKQLREQQKQRTKDDPVFQSMCADLSNGCCGLWQAHGGPGCRNCPSPPPATEVTQPSSLKQQLDAVKHESDVWPEWRKARIRAEVEKTPLQAAKNHLRDTERAQRLFKDIVSSEVQYDRAAETIANEFAAIRHEEREAVAKVIDSRWGHVWWGRAIARHIRTSLGEDEGK